MPDHGDKALSPKPRVVVGLDFGTTYSGFAFAHVSDPDKVYTYYDYPKAAGEKPYCKTLTASYYKAVAPASGAEKGGWKLQSWGYPARKEHERDVQALYRNLGSQNRGGAPASRRPSSASSSFGVEKFFSRFKAFSSRGTSSNAPPASTGVLLTRFKLHLASRKDEASSASPLPPGLTVERVITDYLRELGGLVLKHLQCKYGAHFSNDLIQWCITVPSIWDDAAKATMKACMVDAGLVSSHPVTVVLEPEAASYHCHRVTGELAVEVGDRLLVADLGGGTSDIVVQEVVSTGTSGYRVKEVTVSSGGLCGGTYVDSRFMEFLEGRMGPCFAECMVKHPNVYGQLMKEWECTKAYFDRGQSITTINVPSKLAAEWERVHREEGRPDPESVEYGELDMSYKEMQSIFDPVVEENLELIRRQLVEAGGKVRALVLVGGFPESPYLLHRIKQTFGDMAQSIIRPPNPGSAICQGAVALALNPTAVVSRICRRTYGYRAYFRFEKEVDPIETLLIADGVEYCKTRFLTLVTKGDVVTMQEPKTRMHVPIYKGQKSFGFPLYSCDDKLPPRYITSEVLKPEGLLRMDISKDMTLDKDRRMEMSLHFGGSSVEVKARAVNFNAEEVQLPVQVDYLLH